MGPREYIPTSPSEYNEIDAEKLGHSSNHDMIFDEKLYIKKLIDILGEKKANDLCEGFFTKKLSANLLPDLISLLSKYQNLFQLIDEYILHHPSEINNKYDGDNDLLMIAINNEAPDWFIYYLISKGINLNNITKNNYTALEMAIDKKRDSIGASLIVNKSIINRKQILIKSLENNLVSTVNELIKSGVDINQRKEQTGDTILHMAILHQNPYLIKLFLSNGINTGLFNKNSLTPLHIAIDTRYIDGIRLLLDVDNPPINLLYNDGETILIKVIDNNLSIDIIDLLCIKGCNVNQQNINGTTPLKLAVFKGRLDYVKKLLEHGANPNISNANGFTPLMTACFNGYLEIVTELLKCGADPNSRSKGGSTALRQCLPRDNLTIAEILLTNKADPNIPNNNGLTALKDASSNGKLEFVRILLEHGANPNLKDINNFTSLMNACANGHFDIVKELLKYGADPNIKSKSGLTALIQSVFGDNSNIAKILLDNKADPDISDNNGSTALQHASARGNLNFVKILLEHGANPNSKDKNNFSSLMKACANGHLDIILELLRYNASVTDKNNNGKIAFELLSTSDSSKLLLTFYLPKHE